MIETIKFAAQMRQQLVNGGGVDRNQSKEWLSNTT